VAARNLSEIVLDDRRRRVVNSGQRRDEAVERLLRRLPASVGSPPGPCLEAEIIAAWVDGRLPAAEIAAAEQHASACGRCQAVIATLARATPDSPKPVRWWQRGWSLGWAVPLAAAAAALVLWVVTPKEPPPLTDVPLEVSAQKAEAAPDAIPEESKAASLDSLGSVAKGAPPASPPRQEAVRAGREAERADDGAAAPSGERDAAEEVAAAPDLSAAVARADANEASAVAATPPIVGKAAGTEQAPSPAAAAEALTVAGAAPVGQTVGPLEVRSPNPAVGWRTGRLGEIQHTTDGGSQWETHAAGTTARLLAGASPSPSVCWLVGEAGTVLVTTNGRQWQRVAFPQAVDVIGVQAADARTATVSTRDGRRFQTADGGVTWNQTPPQDF
jgi:hypothetical protein